MPVTRDPTSQFLLVLLEERSRWTSSADVETLKIGSPAVGYPAVGYPAVSLCMVEGVDVRVCALWESSGELGELVFELLVGGVCAE